MSRPAATVECRVLVGSRVRLRPFDKKTDAEALFGLCSDAETVRFYGMEAMRSVAEAEALLESYVKGIRAGTSAHWAIADAQTDEVIGDAGIMSIDSRNLRASSYCLLGSRHWGKGLSQDAMQMLFDHVFATTGINRIQAFIDTRNKRAVRSVRGIGFVREGVLRQYEFDRGEFIDDAVFALTRLDWTRKRHTVFGKSARASRRGLSWQLYEVGGRHCLWIFDGISRRYHLLEGAKAETWLKDASPPPLPVEGGWSENDSRVSRFVVALCDGGTLYEIHWDVTNACNCRCRHCYNHGAQTGRRNDRGGEMGDKECLEVLKALRERGVFRVVFSGGEPLMRHGMLDLLCEARGLGFQVVLYTNGTLVTPECARRLADFRLAAVGVSVYGACTATHDAATGIQGSFDRSLNALKLLSGLGVNTVMKCVALHANVAELADMRAIGAQVAKHTQVNYVFYPGMDGAPDTGGQMLRMAEIVELAMDCESGLHFGETSRQLCRYELGREFVCTRALRSLYLNPHGQVFPCIAIPRTLGHWRNVFGGELANKADARSELSHWREFRFSAVPRCGTRTYCAFCHSACPGDALLLHGDEHAPPTNHCRLAIGKYAAVQWLANQKTQDEWRQFASDERALCEYLDSLGVNRSEYVVRGIV